MTLDRLVTESVVHSLFRSLSKSFVHVTQGNLRASSAPWIQIQRQLIFFESTLFRYLDNEPLWDVYQSLVPEVFLLGSLVNGDDEDSSRVSSMCFELWSGFLARSPEKLLMSVKPTLRARLQFHVENTSSWSR